MELTKQNRAIWDPFDVLEDLQSDMNRVLKQSRSRREGWIGNFDPKLDVSEEEDRYLLKADLPGLKREDFSIAVTGNVLTLKGERKSENEKKTKNLHYAERTYGSFQRTLEFPTEIQAEKVKASYKDGVLEIDLPKSETSKPKQIQVEVK